MIIKCQSINKNLLPSWFKSGEFLEAQLQIGKSYTVYGIHFGNEVLYEILLSDDDAQTTVCPSVLFNIIDNRLSCFFALGNSYEPNHLNKPDSKQISFVSFKEWVDDKTYFERLVDGDKIAKQVFDHYKELLYLEHLHPEIKQKAIMIQDNWVQCPVCTEAWELTYPAFEMCRCPKCSTVFLNPY